MFDRTHPTSLVHSETANAEQPFAVHAGRVIDRGCFWADVQQYADALPERDFVINLCQNRYLFILTLLAAAVRGQTCLLPPSHQAAVIAEIATDYPCSYLASEQENGFAGAWFQAKAPGSIQHAACPEIAWQQAKIIAYTSGSSGKPQAHNHTLETFRISAQMATRRLGLQNQRFLLLSTTPAQHMYGLETSIFWPLFSDLILHDGRPFFPEDLRKLIAEAAWPVVLATTPAHLRHLSSIALESAKLTKIISATDTLSEKLAEKTRDSLGVAPVEIYGSTETLSFASRETLQTSAWQLYDDCQLSQTATSKTVLAAAHLPESVLLQDSIQILDGEHFSVLGRHADMIKIAGKRASLAELNRRLKDIEGLDDGFFFALRATDSERGERLGIVVVTELNSHAIKQALAAYIDEVFLPKKIHFVPRIPRNQAGKLTQATQEALLKSLE